MFEIQESAIAWLSSRFGRVVSPQLNFFEAGIVDSLSFSELLAFMEDKYEVTLDLDGIEDWRDLVSVAAVAEAIFRQIDNVV